MNKKTGILLAIITLCALLIRTYFLARSDLNTYEYNVLLLALRPLSDISYHATSIAHHPLYYYLLRGWLSLVRPMDISGKLFTMLCNIALLVAIPLFSLHKKAVFNKEVALLTALIIAVSPLHIFYSHYVSLYGFFTLIALLSNILFLMFAREEKLSYAVWYVIFTTIMLYTQICGYIMFLIQVASFIFIGNKVKKWAVATLLILAFYLPWHLLFFPAQMARWQVGSAGMTAAVRHDPPVPTLQTLGQTFIDFSAGSPQLFFLLIWIILYGLVKNRNEARVNAFLVAWLLLPPLVLYFVSWHVDYVYKYKELIFVSVPFFILISKGIMCFSRAVKISIITVIVLVSSLALLDKFYLEPPERWSELVSRIKSIRLPSDIVISFNAREPFNYYYKDTHYVSYSTRDIEDIVSNIYNEDRFFVVVKADDPVLNAQTIEYLKKGTLSFQKSNMAIPGPDTGRAVRSDIIYSAEIKFIKRADY